jgi:hypothetical protein
VRRIFLWAAAIAMIAFQVPDASAATMFNWSITSTETGTLTGSGTLDATLQSGSEYLVTSMTGTADGMAVMLIPVLGYQGNENLLYYPATTTSPGGCGPLCQLDNNGLAFSLANGANVNIFEHSDPMITQCDTSGTVSACADELDTSFVTVFSAAPVPVSATPLPAALPLFATGLGAMGLFGSRRKRKAQAAIAA